MMNPNSPRTPGDQQNATTAPTGNSTCVLEIQGERNDQVLRDQIKNDKDDDTEGDKTPRATLDKLYNTRSKNFSSNLGGIYKSFEPEMQTREPNNDIGELVLFPKSVSRLFISRLKGWHTIVKKFYMYASAIVNIEKKYHADAVKAGNQHLGYIRSDSFKIDESQTAAFSMFEMHQVVMKCLLDSDIQLNYDLSASFRYINTTVIAGLSGLETMITKKIDKCEKDWRSFDDELKNDEMIYNKYKEELKFANDYFSQNKSSFHKHHKQTPQDPYIAYVKLRNHVFSCLMKSEKYSDTILEQQASFFGYEIDAILKPFYNYVRIFSLWRSNSSALAQDVHGTLVKMLEKPDYEKNWDMFVSDNKMYLGETSSRFYFMDRLKIADSVSSYVMEQPLSKIIYSGLLLLGVIYPIIGIKYHYDEHFAILTDKGYLHFYKKSHESYTDPSQLCSPEDTICLHNVTIEPLVTENIKNKAYRVIYITENNPGIFSRESSRKITADSEDVVNEWHRRLCEQVKIHRKIEKPSVVINNGGSEGKNVNSATPARPPPPLPSRPVKKKTTNFADFSLAPIKITTGGGEGRKREGGEGAIINNTDISRMIGGKESGKRAAEEKESSEKAPEGRKEEEGNEENVAQANTQNYPPDSSIDNVAPSFPSGREKTIPYDTFVSSNTPPIPDSIADLSNKDSNSQSDNPVVAYNVDDIIEPNPWYYKDQD